MRNNPILNKINPIITFFVVLAVVLGATFLTLRWVESRKAPAAPIAQAPKAGQAPQQEKKEQPAQENKDAQSENKQAEEKPAETQQQPATQQPVQAGSADEHQHAVSATTASSSSSLPGTGLSLAGILTFMIGAGITIYLSLTIRRQKLALRP